MYWHFYRGPKSQRMLKMIYDYEELTQIMCDLETGRLGLEMMVLNGKNEKLICNDLLSRVNFRKSPQIY